MKRRFWTPAEIETLRRRYPHEKTSAIAADIDRTVPKCYSMAGKLGLHKSAEYMASEEPYLMRQNKHLGNGFRFLPGHVPANKGLRRPGFTAGNMAKTQFKKGQKPPNWIPVGTVVVNADGYARVKIKDDPMSIAGIGAHSTNWEFVHVRVWEAAHGPIPKGHRIWWKDRNHNNCALENLELVTEQESMLRNSIHKVLPPELKKTVFALGRVKRAIRKRIRDAKEKQDGRSTGPSLRNVGSPSRRREADGNRPSNGRRSGSTNPDRKRQGGSEVPGSHGRIERKQILRAAAARAKGFAGKRQ